LHIGIPNLLQDIYPNKPIKIDTDVNAAVIGEFMYGNHQVKNSLAYITLGTGIGVGLLVNGKVIHGY